MPRVIGFYDDGLHRAGTGRYLAEIIGGLDRNRFQPVFFAPEERPWHQDLSSLGVEMIYACSRPSAPDLISASSPNLSLSNSGSHEAKTRVGTVARPKLPPKLAWAAGMLKETLRARKLFLSRKVDLLHSNNTGAEPAPIAARLAGIPKIIGTFHVLPSYDLEGTRSGAHYRQLEKWSMGSLHHATSCCEAAMRQWQARCGFDSSLVTVIHNGIDLKRVGRKRSVSEARKALGLPEDSLVLAAIGNLHPYKGYEFLLRAVPQLRDEIPNVRVVIAGTGPAEGDLKKLISSLGIEANVRLLGFCDDVSLVLDSADIYVQPSLVEAFPIAILEASASGLPVVATSVGGVPEAILDSETGLLVPPADPNALCIALSKLARDREARVSMGASGKIRVSSLFTREEMVRKTMDVYEKMMG